MHTSERRQHLRLIHFPGTASHPVDLLQPSEVRLLLVDHRRGADQINLLVHPRAVQHVEAHQSHVGRADRKAGDIDSYQQCLFHNGGLF